MIDLHCHVLPGIDDGPATVAEAVELARAMAADGRSLVVATPHVSAHYPNDRETIARAAASLREALAAAGVVLDVREGAEVELAKAVTLPDGELRALRLAGRRWLLVEPPLSPAAPDPGEALAELLRRGHELVLAHPERCPHFQRAPAHLERLVAGGVLLSVTAGALTGGFGQPARTLARRLLAAGLVHDVASDAHDLRRRPPALRAHLDAAAGEIPGLAAQAEWLIGAAPAAIVVGAPLPPR